MGHGGYSSEVHRSVTMSRIAAGTDFDYSKNLLTQPRHERKAHETLDPKRQNQKGDNAGTIIRESLDFPEHPNTTPIVIVLDVTGSMASVPRQVITELPKLMEALHAAKVPDPQVLICAVGDAYSDTVPLQIGQFESDNRIDEQINNLFPEGGGGGGNHESYELMAYFLANYTHLDSVELRDTKGFCFFLADERVYSKVNGEQIKKLIDDTAAVETGTDTKDVFDDLKAKYEVFMLYGHGAGGEKRCMDEDTGNPDAPLGRGTYGWKALLEPEQVIAMSRPVDLVTQVANIVATRVGEKAEA